MPLRSVMEKEHEKKLARQVKHSPHLWRLHPIYNVPFCSSKCRKCAKYLAHLARAMAGLADEESSDGDSSSEDEDQDEDEDSSGEDEDKEVDEDSSSEDEDDDGEGSGSGWQPPDESDFEDIEGEGDPELRAHMRTVFMLQSARGRLESGDLFGMDPAALGRAQNSIADLMMEIATLEREQEQVQEEFLAVGQQLKSIQTRSEELHEELQRLDSNYQRKRLTMGVAPETADNLMASGEGSQPPSAGPVLHAQPAEADIVQLVSRTAQVTVEDALLPLPRSLPGPSNHQEPTRKQFLRKKIPGANESAEQLARWIQNQQCQVIKGVPACGPDWVVDLRDARGHQVMKTLAPSGQGQRSKSARDWHRSCFLAMLRILIIPGAYAAITRRISAPIADVALSKVDFGRTLDEDTVARKLASKGLTVDIADDCWQFCLKFAEAEINSEASGYKKETLEALVARARATITALLEIGFTLKGPAVKKKAHAIVAVHTNYIYSLARDARKKFRGRYIGKRSQLYPVECIGKGWHLVLQHDVEVVFVKLPTFLSSVGLACRFDKVQIDRVGLPLVLLTAFFLARVSSSLSLPGPNHAELRELLAIPSVNIRALVSLELVEIKFGLTESDHLSLARRRGLVDKVVFILARADYQPVAFRSPSRPPLASRKLSAPTSSGTSSLNIRGPLFRLYQARINRVGPPLVLLTGRRLFGRLWLARRGSLKLVDLGGLRSVSCCFLTWVSRCLSLTELASIVRRGRCAFFFLRALNSSGNSSSPHRPLRTTSRAPGGVLCCVHDDQWAGFGSPDDVALSIWEGSAFRLVRFRIDRVGPLLVLLPAALCGRPALARQTTLPWRSVSCGLLARMSSNLSLTEAAFFGVAGVTPSTSGGLQAILIPYFAPRIRAKLFRRLSNIVPFIRRHGLLPRSPIPLCVLAAAFSNVFPSRRIIDQGSAAGSCCTTISSTPGRASVVLQNGIIILRNLAKVARHIDRSPPYEWDRRRAQQALLQKSYLFLISTRMSLSAPRVFGLAWQGRHLMFGPACNNILLPVILSRRVEHQIRVSRPGATRHFMSNCPHRYLFVLSFPLVIT
ncbi:hypothetical protein B0H11DRAFT_1922351 [Mycena galericulata]|nr:hypothetical protein B0H11DRAFT_1922351 [Mycena galericulata]